MPGAVTKGAPRDVFEWRDICERCHDVVEMPLDGMPPKHLCLTDPIPWDVLLERDLGIAALIILNKQYRLEHGAAVSQRHRRLDGDGDGLGTGEPSQTGPFAPGDPPRLISISDLLLWSRTDLCALSNRAPGPTHSPTVVTAIERWLAEHGLTLAPRYEDALQTFLRSQFSARYTLLPVQARRRLFYIADKKALGRANGAQLRHALEQLELLAFAFRNYEEIENYEEKEEEQ